MCQTCCVKYGSIKLLGLCISVSVLVRWLKTWQLLFLIIDISMGWGNDTSHRYNENMIGWPEWVKRASDTRNTCLAILLYSKQQHMQMWCSPSSLVYICQWDARCILVIAKTNIVILAHVLHLQVPARDC